MNSAQVQKSTVMENFNLLVLHTVIWRRRLHPRGKTRGCTQ